MTKTLIKLKKKFLNKRLNFCPIGFCVIAENGIQNKIFNFTALAYFEKIIMLLIILYISYILLNIIISIYKQKKKIKIPYLITQFSFINVFLQDNITIDKFEHNYIEQKKIFLGILKLFIIFLYIWSCLDTVYIFLIILRILIYFNKNYISIIKYYINNDINCFLTWCIVYLAIFYLFLLGVISISIWIYLIFILCNYKITFILAISYCLPLIWLSFFYFFLFKKSYSLINICSFILNSLIFIFFVIILNLIFYFTFTVEIIALWKYTIATIIYILKILTFCFCFIHFHKTETGLIISFYTY